MLTLLEQAIREGNLAEVERLLVENPPMIEESSSEGLPLSFVAAKCGNLEIVKYIVEYSRANMNVFDKRHRTILHYGVMSGNLELVQYLVERVGMSPLAGDCDLVTPYELAGKLAAIEAYFAKVTGFTLAESYKNPIRTGFYPDPSIIRVGEDYYMVNSSFIFFPCIPVSHSKDLIHWEIIGHAITNPDWAYLDELEGGRGYWAPDISYYKGRYYICATYRLNDTGTVYRRQMVVSAEKPEGPYSEPVFLDEDGIDPSIFTDDDGRRYMLLNRGARIFEISEDATRQIGPASLLFYGDQKRAPEGPHLLKKDGYYYLFEAEGGTGMGHRITVSRAKTLFGVYEPCPYNPIMRQQDEGAAIQRCGHGKPVQAGNGEWYMVYLCGRPLKEEGTEGAACTILGRETALDPITWTADGWPIVNQLKGPSALQKKPLPYAGMSRCTKTASQTLPAACTGAAVSTDILTDTNLFGENNTLTPDWVTPRPPIKGGISMQEGILRLQGSSLPLSDVGARNILLRRQEHFSFVAETEMAVKEMEEGQEAGLVCYYDENTWVSCALYKEQGRLFVRVQEHIGDNDYFHGKKEIVSKMQTIKFRVDTRKLARTFSFDAGEGWQEAAALLNVYYLCDEGLKKGKRFTGAMVGVFGVSGEKTTVFEFLNFAYKSNI